MKKKLVLFDFDGTITTKDTLIEFIRFYVGNWKFIAGLIMLSPMLAMYALKLIPNWKGKQRFLAWFFKGESIAVFEQKCVDFTYKVLPKLIRPQALETIHQYRYEPLTTMVVVSASAAYWVKPWCDQQNIVCLATRLETKKGVITGNLDGRNCYGDEKVCRIKAQFNLEDYDEIIAYGDSSGDKEMFDISTQHFYKPFREKIAYLSPEFSTQKITSQSINQCED